MGEREGDAVLLTNRKKKKKKGSVQGKKIMNDNSYKKEGNTVGASVVGHDPSVKIST